MSYRYISLSCSLGLLTFSSIARAEDSTLPNWKFENEAACVQFFTTNPGLNVTKAQADAQTQEKVTPGEYISDQLKDPKIFCSMLSPVLIGQPNKGLEASAGTSIIFSDTPQFYASLGASLKRFGGKEKIKIEVNDSKFTVSSLTGPLAPPDYRYYPAGVETWIERVQATKGKVVYVDTSMSPLTAGLDIVLPFIFKKALPALIKVAFKANPYAPAKKVNIVITRIPQGAAVGAGRITQIDFVPR
jgi:hypothetical protein